ncbi:MAG: ketoacyl-ACP synthase III [Actinobacteria bacterium]|jgi:3-oxoacyl-[acyl-carrier-protein] synthase-3|nr:ketoacyl-ACP synthase III [Actinomycetota bacterium]
MPSVPQGARGAIITGWGTALPEKTLTNADLETMFDTSDEWIVERTGIRERHVGGTTTELSVESGRKALEMAGLDPSDIDALILATTTPDRAVPATSATVQNLLGLTCGAYDVNAACSGWVYGLITAHGLIAMGADKVLLIGTDTLARITDWTDRNTAILFADGSGATVLEAVDGPGEMLGWDLDSDGSAEGALYCELGGNLEMEGKEVFRRAVRIMVDSATRSMEHAGVVADDIALVVPHQANIRIITASCSRLGIEMDRVSTVLDRTGNTSSASVPLALADALDQGKADDGDLVLFVGFGAGMTAASAVVRWATKPNDTKGVRPHSCHSTTGEQE